MKPPKCSGPGSEICGSGLEVAMNTDYLDAHDRHWDDAERLYAAHRWANADHLYGMAAECGLKRLMLAFSMRFDRARDKPSGKADIVHADGAWARYDSYRCGHHRGVAYALTACNPFSDWHVTQRYAHQNHFDAARASAHQAGAGQVSQLVRKATLEGLI